MPGMFTSKGYRPDKGMMKDYVKNLNNNIAPGGMNYFQDQYTINGKSITPKEAEFYKKIGLGDKVKGGGNSQYQQDKPQFDYNPGSGGYSMMNQKYTPAQNPNYVGGNYNFYDQGAAALGGQLNQATEGAKAGAMAGMDMMNASLGQRGISGGGMQQMGLGNVANTMSKNMADINRNNAMGLANLQQQQQGMNFNANQAQNAFNQQNANRSEQQAQFAPQFGMNQMMNQYNLDKQLRGEQYGYWKDPYNDEMSLYLQQLQSAGQNQPGWLSPVTAGIGAVGKVIGA